MTRAAMAMMAANNMSGQPPAQPRAWLILRGLGSRYCCHRDLKGQSRTFTQHIDLDLVADGTLEVRPTLPSSRRRFRRQR